MSGITNSQKSTLYLNFTVFMDGGFVCSKKSIETAMRLNGGASRRPWPE
jgi:hypothetical protein